MDYKFYNANAGMEYKDCEIFSLQKQVCWLNMDLYFKKVLMQ